MKTRTTQAAAQSDAPDPASEQEMRAHMALLGHNGLGVTELRVFDPLPQVAYADNDNDTDRLCQEMEGKTSGVYVGVQPRPAHLFDLAPNRWVPARGGPGGNCARDSDIEYLATVFFDLDVVSPERAQDHPASHEELQQTLQAARLLAQQDGLAEHSVIACSGNGHYVLAPIAPISIDSADIARKFRSFCQQLADSVAGQVQGARIDPVYNLSRVMRVLGTLNRKGQPAADRPHRRAHFVTPPPPGRSMALHHMILNAEVQEVVRATLPVPQGLQCDLGKIEQCAFIKWCRGHPQEVSEPQWFALISNLARLARGVELIHEISALDSGRYDYADTGRVIERILREGYKPVSCRTIMSPAMVRPGRGVFQCSRIARCPAKAPMYLATSHTVYMRQEVTTMQNESKNKPIKVFRCGPVQAAVWTNQRVIDDAVVEVHSVRIDKSYREGDEWKKTTSFAAEDLPKVAMVATEAYRLLRLRSSQNEDADEGEASHADGESSSG